MSNIQKYAHVAEIVDRITIELLKASEFKSRVLDASSQEEKDKMNNLAHIAEQTAAFQVEVLKERLSEFENGEALATVICGVIDIVLGASIVSRFENLKRTEHHRGENKRIAMIALWDLISRDACERRAQGKTITNIVLTALCPGYEAPAESRTF